MNTQREEPILYLARREVEQLCQEIDSVQIIRTVFQMHGQGQTILPDEAYLGWTNASGETVRSLNMPGYLGDPLHVAGTKIINGNIANPQRGLPRASGLTVLFDDTSVRVVCVMEGAYISSLRTASVTALAAETFQGNAIRHIAVIGAGVLAQAHIELLARRLPDVQEIALFDLSAERAQEIQSQLAPTLEASGIAFRLAKSAEDAIRPAQLIVPVTTTTTGYIPYAWLQPGAILVNVSLDDPLPEIVLKADQVIVDDWSLVRDDTRRLLGRMYREGTLLAPDTAIETIKEGQRRVDAQLGEVVVGARPGRRTPQDIILVNPFGLSLEDIALAAHVYRVARERGIGTLLER